MCSEANFFVDIANLFLSKNGASTSQEALQAVEYTRRLFKQNSSVLNINRERLLDAYRRRVITIEPATWFGFSFEGSFIGMISISLF